MNYNTLLNMVISVINLAEIDEIITLKMQQNSHYQIDSLNVSNAAAICLYELNSNR